MEVLREIKSRIFLFVLILKKIKKPETMRPLKTNLFNLND